MPTIYEEQSAELIVPVHASNAFNSVNVWIYIMPKLYEHQLQWCKKLLFT